MYKWSSTNDWTSLSSNYENISSPLGRGSSELVKLGRGSALPKRLRNTAARNNIIGSN
jgi:hypothetical protein